jgi:alpha-tubulin suppressor-like RCC1 family protein
MSTLSSGPSHSSAVSVKKELYTWGHKQGGRLGLNMEECKRTKREPVLVSFLNEVMIKNKQNMKEGIRGGEEED